MRRQTRMNLFAWLLLAHTVFGAGMLIPKDPSLAPLAIKHQRVSVNITDGVADARIEQVFKNNVARDLEAVYVFPLPPNASIGEFAMYINGKRVRGELLEKGRARRIYEDIVRRLKDPGLLEHMGGDLFRVSVYPVPAGGEQKLEISYSQTLQYESGLYKMVYPLRTGKKASRTMEDFTVSAALRSKVPLKTIYSPSHKIGISRKGEHEATIGFEENRSVLDRDFVLYYGVSRKRFGLNLLAHAAKDTPGFFMMMLSPEVNPPKDTVVARDVTFVMDTSGSMAGEKITQAREALTYCVNRLNKNDRFNIIRFSTDVERFADSLRAVGKPAREEALRFVRKMEARGGTDINGALQDALALERDGARPYTIVFLTDGKPTVGTTATEDIVDGLAKRMGTKTRVFVFGVGERVNTHLLDRIAGAHGGTSQYVRPNENIEVVVSAFYDKISHPVLIEPTVQIDNLKVKQVHPQKLPNLFGGTQLTVFGRYEGGGHVAIRLKGEVNGKPTEFVYEATFPEQNAENDFIPRLWATRRVGYLLDQIRLHGEEKELKDEVLLLSKDYGIMTPYTSYLVVEDEKAAPRPGIGSAAPRPQPHVMWKAQGLAAGRAPEARAREEAPAAAMPVFGEAASDSAAFSHAGPGRYRRIGGGAGEVNGYMKKEDGAEAVDLSEAIGRYRSAEAETGQIARNVRYVGKKIFYLINGTWVDRDYRKGLNETRVAYGSEAYFALLNDKPELSRFLALGEKVIVCTDKNNAIIVE